MRGPRARPKAAVWNGRCSTEQLPFQLGDHGRARLQSAQFAKIRIAIAALRYRDSQYEWQGQLGLLHIHVIRIRRLDIEVTQT